MSVIYDALGKKKSNIFIPFPIAYFFAKALDFIAKIIKKKFSISSIRVKKFCSNTSFETSISKIGYVPKVAIKDAIIETINYFPSVAVDLFNFNFMLRLSV